MLAYNKEWLDNLALRKASLKWLKKNIFSKEEHDAVLQKYPTQYKESGIFVRIGMFLLTLIALGALLALLMVLCMGGGNEKEVTSVVLIIFGITVYCIGELFAGNKHHYRSGILDAMLYVAIICTVSGIIALLPDYAIYQQPIIEFIIIFPFVAIVAVRFADAFLSVAAFIVLLIINGMAILKLGDTGKMILPFECMAISYVVYFAITKLMRRDGMRFWNWCLNIMKMASLAALYLSGNYMTIRKLTEALLNTEIGPGQDISLAFFFYAYTIIVPIAYIWIGLKRKDYVFLRLGLMLLVGGILSIKYYHSLMPPETAMILGGTFMTLLAYFSIRYLKTPKYGITFESDEQSERHKAMVNIANVAISQVMSSQPQPTKSADVEFGGGEFGGGGAGAEF